MDIQNVLNLITKTNCSKPGWKHISLIYLKAKLNSANGSKWRRKLQKPANPLARCLPSINQTPTSCSEGPGAPDYLTATKTRQTVNICTLVPVLTYLWKLFGMISIWLWYYVCFFSSFAAVMTAFFPCVTFGQIAEVLDGGEMGKLSFICSLLLFSSWKNKHNLGYLYQLATWEASSTCWWCLPCVLNG